MEMKEDYTVTDKTWTVKPITLPKVIGGYRLGKQISNNLQFTMTHKPIWLHRQMMRICFGWYWFDVER
jgi:hypothetical protein